MRAPVPAVLVAICLVLSACGSSDDKGKAADAPKGTYVLDGATGETRASITTADGTITMRAGEKVRAELPLGFTLYPGAEIRDTVEVARQAGRTLTDRHTGGAEGHAVVLSLASADPPEDLIAHYRAQAQAAGIVIDIELRTDALSMIGGQGPDGTRFVFQTGRRDDTTTGQLTTGQLTTGQLTIGRGLD